MLRESSHEPTENAAKLQLSDSARLTRIDLQVRLVAALAGMTGLIYIGWLVGSIEAIKAFIMAWAAYVTLVVGIAMFYWRNPQPFSRHYLFYVSDAFCITASLAVMGQLISPLVIIYWLAIMMAVIVNGRRAGIVATVASVVTWGTAFLLTIGGVLNDEPAFKSVQLSGTWEFPAFFLWGVSMLAGALYAAVIYADLARRHMLQTEREYSESLERTVEDRTRDLRLANEELRTVQTRLMEAERLAAAGEIAGGVAHAINNPLAALIGTGSNYLETSEIEQPEVSRMVQIARRISAVVEGLLQLSRRGTMHPEHVGAAKVLDELKLQFEDRCKQQGVEIHVTVRTRGSKLFADPVLLHTALQSLAENAVEAMPDGGTLGLEANLIDGTDAIEFRVSDTGAGIPAEYDSKIMEAFFTTKPRGTGLGLSIAHGIIRGHEGTLRFNHRPEGGTLASVIMPRRVLAEDFDEAASVA